MSYLDVDPVIVDEIAVRYMDACDGGTIPPIQHYLPAEESAERLPILIRLLKVRMDYCREEAGAPPGMVQRDLAEFPELRHNENLRFALELLKHEFLVRVERRGVNVEVFKQTSSSETERILALLDEAEEKGVPLDGFLFAYPEYAEAMQVFLFEHETQFAVEKLLGRGGMGIVFGGMDLPFSRPAALKIIRGDKLRKNQALRDRFDMEVRISGRLRHSGNTPVYRRGTLPTGSPYLLMQVIEGRSLVEKFAHRSQSHEDQSYFMDIFERICDTVGYAHDAGIIHRDLKPANVMVDAYKQVLVVDWGAAFEAGKTQPPSATMAAAIIGSNDTARISRAPTEGMAIIGTWAYMPPEQARGEGADLRSDVFGLGAILCEILTGSPPYLGTGDQLERDARQGNLQDAYQRIKDSRADLTIVRLCLECLAHNGESRPPNALAVASRVQKYFEETAKRYQKEQEERVAAETGKRWWRIVGLLLGVVALLTLTGTLGVYKQWQRAEGHLTTASSERNRADENAARARGSVQKYFTDISESPELLAHGLEPLRQQLLLNAKVHYEEFVREESDNPQLQAELAWAHLRLGLIHYVMNENTDAEKEYLLAMEAFTRLSGKESVAEDSLDGKGRAQHDLALIYQITGRYDQAVHGFADSITTHEQLLREYPGKPQYKHDLAKHHGGLGIVFAERKQFEKAESAFTLAHELQEALFRDFPKDGRYQSELAKTKSALGNVYSKTGRFDRAETIYKEALPLQEKLAAEHPGVPEYQSALAATHYNLAALYVGVGRLVEAERSYRRSLQIMDDLAKLHPKVPDYQAKRAKILGDLGRLLRAAGLYDDGEQAYLQALAIQTALALEYENISEYQADMAANQQNLGNLYAVTNQHDKAKRSYAQARDSWDNLRAKDQNNPQYQANLALLHSVLGNVYQANGEFDEAEAAQRLAVGVLEKLVHDYPKVPRFVVDLGSACCNLGNLVSARGDAVEAVNWYDKAIANLKKALEQESQNADTRDFLRNALVGRARACNDLGRHQEAKADFEEIMQLSEQPSVELRVEFAATIARLGDHVRAADEAQQLASSADLSPETLYNLACVFALSSVAAKEDSKLAEQHGIRAVELLTKARAAGYFKDAAAVVHMKQDSDIDPIRSREDFKKLLGELEAQIEAIGEK